MCFLMASSCQTGRAWGTPSDKSILCPATTPPDPAPVHLDDLLGDGEPKARAALGLGKGTVDLVELIEDPTLLVEWYAGTGVCHRDGEMAVPCARGDTH